MLFVFSIRSHFGTSPMDEFDRAVRAIREPPVLGAVPRPAALPPAAHQQLRRRRGVCADREAASGDLQTQLPTCARGADGGCKTSTLGVLRSALGAEDAPPRIHLADADALAGWARTSVRTVLSAQEVVADAERELTREYMIDKLSALQAHESVQLKRCWDDATICMGCSRDDLHKLLGDIASQCPNTKNSACACDDQNSQ